ncbi:hypothetical protein A3K72_01215 [Candidatus Woesearchaeota archaeon RBG_13_36_6]|nr:MAG: hypothetical protein A3K72_01215 [Candidatus Woesearchaeota archaeon RBG_13_36_6]
MFGRLGKSKNKEAIIEQAVKCREHISKLRDLTNTVRREFDPNLSALDKILSHLIKYTEEQDYFSSGRKRALAELISASRRTLIIFDSSNPNSMVTKLSTYQIKFSKISYRGYFKRVKENVVRFGQYQKDILFPLLGQIVEEKDAGKIMDLLLILLEGLQKQLVFFERNIIIRLEKSLYFMKQKDDIIKAEYERLIQKIEKAQHSVGAITRDRTLAEVANITFQAENDTLKYVISLYKGLLEAIDEFDSNLRKTYNEEYLLQNNIPDYLKPKQTLSNIYQKWLSDINRLERRRQFLIEFKKHYDSNNQEGMQDSFLKYVKSDPKAFDSYTSIYITEIGHYQLRGTRSNLIAYVGIFPRLHHRDIGRAEPWQYAEKLRDRIIKGISPIEMKTHGSFFGVNVIGNRFLYIKPHDQYGGMHALISFNCNGYCVFAGEGGTAGKGDTEYVIFTNQSIPPQRLTLLIQDPNKMIYSSNMSERDYQIELVKALKKLKVPFQLR